PPFATPSEPRWVVSHVSSRRCASTMDRPSRARGRIKLPSAFLIQCSVPGGRGCGCGSARTAEPRRQHANGPPDALVADPPPLVAPIAPARADDDLELGVD